MATLVYIRRGDWVIAPVILKRKGVLPEITNELLRRVDITDPQLGSSNTGAEWAGAPIELDTLPRV